jgi:hypothetical protein
MRLGPEFIACVFEPKCCYRATRLQQRLRGCVFYITLHYAHTRSFPSAQLARRADAVVHQWAAHTHAADQTQLPLPACVLPAMFTLHTQIFG